MEVSTWLRRGSGPAFWLALLLLARPAGAGTADALDVKASCEGERCHFEVTVRHDDTGWDHYANGFEVLDPEGRVLATRVLRHPHVDEQPFTRSLDAKIPLSVTRVSVRVRDSRHGYGGEQQEVTLVRAPKPASP